MSSRRRLAGALLTALALVSGILGLLPGPTAEAEPAPPAPGWRALSRTVDRGGIEIIRLARDVPRTRARVAIIPRSQIHRLRTVRASEQLIGGERDLTTSLCARAHCHAAINGDRWDLSGHDAGRTSGALAIDGELWATQPLPPADPYAHALIGRSGSMDGTIVSPLPISPTVASGDVTLPVAVNRQPSDDNGAISLLTRRYSTETRTPPGTVEYLLSVVGNSPDQAALAPIERRESSGPIPEGGVVVAATSDAAVAQAEAWWSEVLLADGASYDQGLDDTREIIGGSPLLLDDSAYGFPLDRGDGRQPRSIIGWDATRLLLVAIDGRQSDWSVGATLIESAQLMRFLGATDALNVDGGSSTTFVDHGILTNRPSAGTQLRVAEALVLMPPEGKIGPPPPARSLDPACPPGRVPPSAFTDIGGNLHAGAISCMGWWQVTTGLSASAYGPDRNVRRDQMATFLARLLYVSGVPFPANPPDAFPDDEGSVHEPYIDAMAAMGVISGQADGTYVPRGAVTRGQMATFLARALPRATGQPLPNTTDYFADDSSHTHELSINQVTEVGVAGGTADGRYEPGDPVRRDQMASFLARSLSAAVAAGRATPPG